MFQNITGATLAAKRLKTRYAIKMSQAQQAVAIVAGYRDWHHLTLDVGTTRAPQSLGSPAALMNYAREQQLFHGLTFNHLLAQVTPITPAGALLPDDHLPHISRKAWPAMRLREGDAFKLWPTQLSKSDQAEFSAAMSDLKNAVLVSGHRLATDTRSFDIETDCYDDNEFKFDRGVDVTWKINGKEYGLAFYGGYDLTVLAHRDPQAAARVISDHFEQAITSPRDHPEAVHRLVHAMYLRQLLMHGQEIYLDVEPGTGRLLYMYDDIGSWCSTNVTTPRRFRLQDNGQTETKSRLIVETEHLAEWSGPDHDDPVFNCWAAELRTILDQVNQVLLAANHPPIPELVMAEKLSDHDKQRLENIVLSSDVDEVLIDFIVENGLQDKAAAYVSRRKKDAPPRQPTHYQSMFSD